MAIQAIERIGPIILMGSAPHLVADDPVSPEFDAQSIQDGP